jgi:hypothetical protein
LIPSSALELHLDLHQDLQVHSSHTARDIYGSSTGDITRRVRGANLQEIEAQPLRKYIRHHSIPVRAVGFYRRYSREERGSLLTSASLRSVVRFASTDPVREIGSHAYGDGQRLVFYGSREPEYLPWPGGEASCAGRWWTSLLVPILLRGSASFPAGPCISGR